jgi:hypothetical protein
MARKEEVVMKTWFVLVALLVAAPVFAQPGPRRGSNASVQQPRRERIKKRIRALRAYTLTDELQLDSRTAGKLFPLLARFDDELDKLLDARADIVRRLEKSAQVTDPKQLDKLIDDAIANQRAMWDTEDKRLAELRKILTPAQTARVLVVLPAMERKIQNQLRRAVRKAGKARKAAVDDDDINPFDVGTPVPARVPTHPVDCDPFSSVHGCPLPGK